LEDASQFAADGFSRCRKAFKLDAAKAFVSDQRGAEIVSWVFHQSFEAGVDSVINAACEADPLHSQGVEV
jgi:hypothetical protein